MFRHPEHGIGQVSVVKTVAHETLLEDSIYVIKIEFYQNFMKYIIFVKCFKYFLEVIPNRVCIKVYSSELVNYLHKWIQELNKLVVKAHL